MWLGAAVGLVLGLGFGILVATSVDPDVDEAPGDKTTKLRATIASPEPIYIDRFRSQVAITPDGSRVIFTVRNETGTQLYQRRLDEARALPISGTMGASQPIMSPNGEWLAFHTETELQRMPLDGGVPQSLLDARNSFGTYWATDDTIFFSPRPSSGIWRVSSRGGAPEIVTKPALTKGEVAHHRPSTLLPGGGRVLVAIWYRADRYDIAVLDLTTGEYHNVLRGVSYAKYVRTGHLVFSRPDGLYAVRFDPDSGTTTGAEVPLYRDAYTSEASNLAHFDISENGTLVYVSGMAPRRELVLVDRSGNATALPMPPRRYAWPRFSPDGKRIALTIQEGGPTGAWVADPARGTLAPLSRIGNVGEAMVWSPDGERVVYTSDMDEPGRWRVYSRPHDGSAEAAELYDYHFNLGGFMAPEVLLGGHWPSERYPWDGPSTVSLNLGVENKVDMLIPFEPGSFVYNAIPSPDRKWMIYVLNEAGRTDLYLTSLPPGERRIVSSGGSHAAWVGGEIFFERLGNQGIDLVVVRVEGPDAALSEPEPLFSLAPFWLGDNITLPNWDPTPDGTSFVMTRFVDDPDTAPPQQLEIVTNFLDELREKVP